MQTDFLKINLKVLYVKILMILLLERTDLSWTTCYHIRRLLADVGQLKCPLSHVTDELCVGTQLAGEQG